VSGPGNFGDWCEAVRAVIDHGADAVAQLEERDRAEMLLQLIKWKAVYGTLPQWKRAHDDVAAILGYTSERMQGVMSLHSITEIRRALRVEPREPYPRQEDELVYPTTGWFGDYLEIHAGMEVPLAWHFWSAVAAVASIAQRNYVFDCGSFWLYPHHYVMIVGPTGEKKSSAISQATRLLDCVNFELQRWGDEQIPPRKPTVYVHKGRGSPEGFSDEIAVSEELALHNKSGEVYSKGREQSTAIIINDEVVSILGKDQPGSARWVELLTTLYTENDWDETLRGRKKKYYRDIAVSALFGTTSDWLRTACTPESFGSGWMARVVYVERQTSNRMFSTPDIVDPVRVRSLACEIAELGIPKNTEMLFSRSARDFHHEWYKTNHTLRHQSWVMNGWYNRKDAHLRKLCMVLALADRPRTNVIEVRHLELALRLLAVEEERLPKAFMHVVSKEPAVALHRMIDVLRKREGKVMQRTDLFRACHRFIGNKREMDMLIETGVATGMFETGTTTPPKGRPAQWVKLVREDDAGA
jgi:hypothetical protein